MNTGEVPLTYLSVVLADAGHDYEVIAARGNFRKVVVDLDGQPTMLDRARFLESLSG
jgi:oxalate decarboxylase/phosphoglucose isomerase-like protein (cupin superfamily)